MSSVATMPSVNRGPIVKICGLSTSTTLDAALQAGADMVGFVFFPASPRHITLDHARTLGARVAGRAKTVALTVDAGDAELAAIVAALRPDLLQLHGTETSTRVAAVRATFGLPVIRAIGLRSAADLDMIPAYDAVADHLLFDARPPAGADRPGGHGATFDWTLLRGMRTRNPWLLAGGLTPDNVAAALCETEAPGLDVSSGVESAPGIKDVARIARFVMNARSVAAPLPHAGNEPDRLGRTDAIG